MKKFIMGICFIVLIISPGFLNAQMNPERAVRYIQNELEKKGLRDLKVKYQRILIDFTQYNIYIEFGEKERPIQEGADILYESALIVGNLQPIVIRTKGMDKSLVFKVGILKFTKMGKIVCWILGRYCAKAIWDDMIQGSVEREQYILSQMVYERY